MCSSDLYHPYQEEYEKLPTGEIKAAQGLQPQYLTPEQQQKTGLKDITGAAKDVIGIGKDIYGMFSGKSSDESERGGMGTEGEEDSKTGMLKSLGKMGLSAAANYFLPGSGTLLSGFMADGGRIHKQEAGPVIGGVVPSDEQLDYVARTMMREDPRNMEAIGHVIRNRMLSWRYGTTPQEVVTARKQFTPWNEELRGTRADPRLIKTSDPLYAKALGAARTVFGGESEDPTGGATHFYNPKLASPKWGSGMQDRIQIGEHAYGKADAGAGLGNAARSELAASRAAIPMGDPRRRFIAMDREKPTEEPKEEGGLGGLLTEQNVLPALMGIGKGISGMMSAKTVSPGAAIAAGLGEGLAGGAESYLGTKKTLADVAKTRAEEALRRAQVGVEEETAGLLGTQSLKEAMEAGNLGIKQMGPADAPFYIVTTEDGTKMFLDQWASMESPPNLIGGAVVSNIAKRLAAKSEIGRAHV